MIRSRNSAFAVGIASVAALVALLFGLAADKASAATVACGDTLSRNTTLQADLTCSGDGLIIGADRITVDLNGHTVSALCHEAPCPVTNGIDNGGGYDNVRILNGAVSFFEHSILLDGARRNTLSGLNLDGGGFGRTGSTAISLTRSDDNVIANSVIRGGDPAVLLSDSDRNTISGASIRGGVDLHLGDGIVLQNGSDDNRVERNEIEGLSFGASISDSRQNDFSRNTVSSFAGALVLDRAESTTVSRNTLRAGQGPSLRASDSDRNQIQRNVAENAILIDGEANSVERNEAHGDFFGGSAILISGGDQNVVKRNRASGSFGDAVIRIAAAATRTKLTRNFATGGYDPYGTDDGDGIKVEAPGTVISRNTANDNQDLGIDAVSGVIDGGGNHASGNGDPRQCVNVVCTP